MFQQRRVRGLKPPSVVSEKGGRHFRGAQCRAIVDQTATFRLYQQPNITVERTCDVSLLNGVVEGDPCVLEISDPSSGEFSINAVYGAAPTFSYELGWARDGVNSVFCPGAIPASMGGNEGCFD